MLIKRFQNLDILLAGGQRIRINAMPMSPAPRLGSVSVPVRKVEP